LPRRPSQRRNNREIHKIHEPYGIMRRVLGFVDIAPFATTGDTEQDAMDILDILLLALVLWIAADLLNDNDWGGGKRSRTPCLTPLS
jgi:hypothetical protein